MLCLVRISLSLVVSHESLNVTVASRESLSLVVVQKWVGMNGMMVSGEYDRVIRLAHGLCVREYFV